MAGRIIQLIVVCISAVLLAGCLSVNVEKTEKSSAKAVAPAETGAQVFVAEPAD